MPPTKTQFAAGQCVRGFDFDAYVAELDGLPSTTVRVVKSMRPGKLARAYAHRSRGGMQVGYIAKDGGRFHFVPLT